jgi:5-formyltetrahydrofolate cyclo-ligase
MSESAHIDNLANELSSRIAQYQALVTYVPLRSEVPFVKKVTLPQEVLKYEIAPRASLDPEHEALRVTERFGTRNTAILIPGRTFDAYGTRHGQGGGWYDRFLSNVPATWTRIGFCFEDQFSTIALERNTWDEPMDMVCVCARADDTIIGLHANDRARHA